MVCKFIEDEAKSAEENMKLDSLLLESLKDENNLILHFYEWKHDSTTFGHFVDPEQYLNLEAIKEKGIDLARRPTGGGITFHHSDLAFSVLVPASHRFFTRDTLKNYAFINERVKKAVEMMHSSKGDLLKFEEPPLDTACKNFCMAKPTKYDVMMSGRKIGGAAQRLTKFGYLHQGSVLLGAVPKEYLNQVLKEGTRVAEAMQRNSFPLLGEKWTKIELQDARVKLKSHLKKVFSEEL